jgi:hypothetical protein
MFCLSKLCYMHFLSSCYGENNVTRQQKIETNPRNCIFDLNSTRNNLWDKVGLTLGSFWSWEIINTILSNLIKHDLLLAWRSSRVPYRVTFWWPFRLCIFIAISANQATAYKGVFFIYIIQCAIHNTKAYVRVWVRTLNVFSRVRRVPNCATADDLCRRVWILDLIAL